MGVAQPFADYRGGFGRAAILCWVALAGVGCGGKSHGGGASQDSDSEIAESEASLLSVGGTWATESTLEVEGCAQSQESRFEMVLVEQRDARVELQFQFGESFVGTLGLDRVMDLEGSDGGRLQLRVTPSVDAMEYSFSGVYVHAGECQSVSRIIGGRVSLEREVSLARELSDGGADRRLRRR